MFCDLCKCSETAVVACSRVRFDGLENDRENSDQRDALDRANSLHEQQTREMLYGAVVLKRSNADASAVAEITESGDGRRRIKIRWRISVGSL